MSLHFDIQATCGPAKKLRRLAAAGAIILGLVPAATAQEMPIGIGDQVEVIITGLPTLGLSAPVLENGKLNLAWLGDFDADGRSIEELESNVRATVAGQIVRQYDREGGQYLVQLEAADVNLIRTAQKPVIVAGAVTTPGEVPFTPNLTVREALALAGGVDDRLLPDSVEVDALQIARWQSDFGQAAIDNALATIQSWRIEAEIANDPDPVLSMDNLGAISAETVAEMEAGQRRILAENLAASAATEAFYVQAVLKAEQRLDILRQQQETMTEALAAEEAEEARILDLVERGLAPGSRESDVRRTTVLTATRLLDVEDDLARTEIDLTRTARGFEEYQEERIAQLLNEQVTVDQLAREARLRMDVVGQFLALSGSEVATADVTSEFGVTTVLFRRSEGQLRQIQADMDTLLMPGDTLEANFEEILPVPLTD
ncbi:MAG: polysaccharide biosynthesis/export family protein [Pseudomonadota bacterium]